VVGHELLGEDYELVTTIPHYYDGESVGSRVYVFESGLDQSRGFVEMGATLELPPVISYGHGEVAEVALAEHAIARLSEFYGPHEYQLVRSHFTAIHPVLEFESAYGSFFYDAAADDISHVFAVSDDPDPDEQAQMIRAQSFLRQWDSYLNQP
ncbi:MAG: hypothetical protein KC457_07475, partial [Myxococcales bacterium]|nr:hypothetical protein [Myxococcales bacterium]